MLSCQEHTLHLNGNCCHSLSGKTYHWLSSHPFILFYKKKKNPESSSFLRIYKIQNEDNKKLKWKLKKPRIVAGYNLSVLHFKIWTTYHHLEGFPGGSTVSNAGDSRDVGSIPGSGRSPGIGNDNPLQYSCLENSMDRGACLAGIVYRATKSWIRLSDCTHKHTEPSRTIYLFTWFI